MDLGGPVAGALVDIGLVLDSEIPQKWSNLGNLTQG